MKRYPVITESRLACRREDLEDMLADPAYFQAVFHSLPRVKALFQAQAELGMANESIASPSCGSNLLLDELSASTPVGFFREELIPPGRFVQAQG